MRYRACLKTRPRADAASQSCPAVGEISCNLGATHQHSIRPGLQHSKILYCKASRTSVKAATALPSTIVLLSLSSFSTTWHTHRHTSCVQLVSRGAHWGTAAQRHCSTCGHYKDNVGQGIVYIGGT